MANNTPLSGLTDAAGGVTLPFEQGELLVNGILQEAGAIQLAGDARATSTRKEIYSIWQGLPTSQFVGEGGTKPVTGASFGAGTATVKKVATIITFTDEMLEDLANGDVNVLVDSSIRRSIADTIDSDAIKGSNFDSHLNQTTSTVTMNVANQDSLASAVSAALGTLEASNYHDPAVLVPSDFPRHIRDARAVGVSGGGTASVTQTALPYALYQPIGGDPLYGAPHALSTNLDKFSTSGGTVAYVFNRPNIHVRVRKDVTIQKSNEASVGGTSLWQNDLTALRYVTRLAYFIHDINNSVVKIVRS